MNEPKGNGAAIEYVESHRDMAERDEQSRARNGGASLTPQAKDLKL